MPGLDDIQIQNVVKAYDILFFQNSNVAIDVKVFQQLFPHIKVEDSDDFAQDVLWRATLAIVLIGAIKCALNNNGVKVGENFVFLKHHGACPRTVVNGKVEDPLMCSCLTDVVQKFLKIFLVLQNIFVVVSHLRDAYDLAALLQED